MRGIRDDDDESPFLQKVRTGKIDFDAKLFEEDAERQRAARERKRRAAMVEKTARRPARPRSSRPRFIIPIWFKLSMCLVVFVFVFFVFYELLPAVANSWLAINVVNTSALPEPVRESVGHALLDYVKDHPACYQFSSYQAERELSKQFPQIQDLKVSLSVNTTAFFTVSVTGTLRDRAAVVRNSDSFFLLDPSGFVISRIPLGRVKEFDLPHITATVDFPVTVGAEADSDELRSCLGLLDVLHSCNEDLYKKVDEVAVAYRKDDETTAIIVQMKGGLEVRMSDIQPTDNLWKFDIFDKVVRNQLGLDPFSDIAYVDLRCRTQIPLMLRSTQREQMRLPEWVKPALEKDTTPNETKKES